LPASAAVSTIFLVGIGSFETFAEIIGARHRKATEAKMEKRYLELLNFIAVSLPSN
jgi:hypothetical protein